MKKNIYIIVMSVCLLGIISCSDSLVAPSTSTNTDSDTSTGGGSTDTKSELEQEENTQQEGDTISALLGDLAFTTLSFKNGNGDTTITLTDTTVEISSQSDTSKPATVSFKAKHYGSERTITCGQFATALETKLAYNYATVNGYYLTRAICVAKNDSSEMNVGDTFVFTISGIKKGSSSTGNATQDLEISIIVAE